MVGMIKDHQFVGGLKLGNYSFVREPGPCVLQPTKKKHKKKSTLPETNSSHLKMDGWEITYLLGPGLFSGANC